MSEKIYLNLLIFGGILFQGIFGSVLEDNHKNSSNLHLREKRMVPGHMVHGDSMDPGHTLRGLGDWLVNDAIHIVKIYIYNVQICTGVIVTPVHILTPQACVYDPPTGYRVVSGAPARGPIITHEIEDIDNHHLLDLLLIDPPTSAGSRFSRPILPAGEALPGGIHYTIIAWGSTGEVRPIMEVERANLWHCAHTYGHLNYHVSLANNICTVQSNEPHSQCMAQDVGSALVVGDRIFGVLVQAGNFAHGLPNVFLRVNNGNQYYRWLMPYVQPYADAHPYLYNPRR